MGGLTNSVATHSPFSNGCSGDQSRYTHSPHPDQLFVGPDVRFVGVHRRFLAIICLISLVAAACTGGSDSAGGDTSDTERQRPEASTLPPAETDPDFSPDEELEPPPEENPDDGRLVVQHRDGQLSTMLPDGEEAAELTDAGTTNSQPSWAPDGSRVAWVAVNDATGETFIASDRYDRSDYREVAADETPYYLYWDPSASRIAHLSSSPAGIDLGVAELLGEDGPTNRRVDRGQPFYLAWGPDGDELLVHASGFRLDRIDLGSATIIIDEFPANFGAASWLADNTLLFADIEDGEQFLVSTGGSGEGRRPLVTYEGALRFSVSNEGNRIVMQASPADDEDGIITASTDPADDPYPVITASHSAPLDDGSATSRSLIDPVLVAFQPPDPTPTPEYDDSLDQIDPIETGIPYLMGTFGGDVFPLSEQPASAIFPSPDGQTIAWFEEVLGGSGAMSLIFDTNGQRVVLPPFVPSAELARDYLPMFDQYEQSHDFWSPSSNLFVYAGRPLGSDDPNDGIWVFDLEAGQQTRIADGVVASFTRTPQAGGAASSL